MTLEEVHAFLTADKDDDRRRVLTTLAARLEQAEPDTALVPDRVQVLTMHGVKGLPPKSCSSPASKKPSCLANAATIPGPRP